MSFRCLLLLALAACGDNHPSVDEPDAAVLPDADTGPRAVTLAFQPMVGAAPFACGSSYASMGAEATTITPRDFRFYVHDVALVTASGEHVPVTLDQDGTWQYQNVAFLDFEDFTGGCADGTPETNVAIRGTVPAGTYTGMAFTLGVPENLNHVDLTSLPAPLNVTGLWWSWRFGHIFLAAVTHAEITTPAPGTNDHYVHIGSIGCTGDPTLGEAVTCSKPNRSAIEVTGFDPLTQPIIADYGVLFAKSQLATSIGCHSFSEEPCAWAFDAAGLNWYTGSQTPTTQTLFRAP